MGSLRTNAQFIPLLVCTLSPLLLPDALWSQPAFFHITAPVIVFTSFEIPSQTTAALSRIKPTRSSFLRTLTVPQEPHDLSDLCPFCWDSYKDALQPPTCSHKYCKACLERLYDEGVATCPVCHTDWFCSLSLDQHWWSSAGVARLSCSALDLAYRAAWAGLLTYITTTMTCTLFEVLAHENLLCALALIPMFALDGIALAAMNVLWMELEMSPLRLALSVKLLFTMTVFLELFDLAVMEIRYTRDFGAPFWPGEQVALWLRGRHVLDWW
jgi:hypothetical protein